MDGETVFPSPEDIEDSFENRYIFVVPNGITALEHACLSGRSKMEGIYLPASCTRFDSCLGQGFCYNEDGSDLIDYTNYALDHVKVYFARDYVPVNAYRPTEETDFYWHYEFNGGTLCLPVEITYKDFGGNLEISNSLKVEYEGTEEQFYAGSTYSSAEEHLGSDDLQYITFNATYPY